jgi:hypothetical protein
MQTPDVVALVPGFLGFTRFGGFYYFAASPPHCPTTGERVQRRARTERRRGRADGVHAATPSARAEATERSLR